MFGKKAAPCMVFEYGCLMPVAGEGQALAQIKGRNIIWNKLVEIEHKHREIVRGLFTVPDNPVIQMKERLKEIQGEMKARRIAERKGNVDITDLQAEAQKLKERIKEAAESYKGEYDKIKESNKDRLEELDQERKKLVKETREGNGLYWTNHDDVIASYDAARKRVLKDRKELRFHRFDGSGKLFVRWQQGLPVEDVFGMDTRLRIDPVPAAAWDHPERSQRRKLARTKVRIRVGSEGTSPIWLELPMVMHRPLPENGVIRSAAVIREKLGNKYRYKLVITVALPENYRPTLAGHGAVGIDLGWRKVGDGNNLRVAYWHDTEGESGQLILPESVTSQFVQLDNLRSIRNQHFNDCKAQLSTWTGNKSLPDWLKEEISTLSQWRSPGRMVLLLRKWRESRFPGDQEIVAYLEEWDKRNWHLWSWEFNLRDQIQRHRREIYRVFAAEITRKYKAVYMEKFNLSDVAKKPTPENGTIGSLPMDNQRFVASVSTLRGAIETACKREKVDIGYAESEGSTIECNKCGHIEKFDAANHIMHTCSNCGVLWDQDENAAKNILKRGLSQMRVPLAQ